MGFAKSNSAVFDKASTVSEVYRGGRQPSVLGWAKKAHEYVGSTAHVSMPSKAKDVKLLPQLLDLRIR